jgi:short-subunit dehydrogenase
MVGQEGIRPMSPNGTALVTGASSGIGAAYDVRILPADLTDGGDRARVEHVLRTDPAIVLLVNNAGIAVSGDFVDADPAQLDRLIALNVLAPTRLARAVLPAFIERRRGTLINISSAVALAPEWVSAAYSGSKAYVLNLSRRLQQEVAAHGIRVQVVLPGAVRTDLWEKSGVALASLQARTLMDVDDVVDAALAGLDQGETVTIPSLPDVADWSAYDSARRNLLPKLSRDAPAPRYGVTTRAGRRGGHAG